MRTLSRPGAAPGLNRNAAAPVARSSLSVCWLLAENDGVQTSQLARLIGCVEMLSDGNDRSTVSRPGYCVCEPPRLRLAPPNERWKATLERMVASCWYGL